jgi:hypothetical protein
MIKKTYALITGCSFFIGILLCAYLNNWIIIRLPSYSHDVNQFYTAENISKKKVSLFFWKHDQWRKETTQLLWSEDTQKNIETLIKAWFTLLEDEGLITTPVRLQSVLLSPTKTHAYLSFDRNFLPQDGPTYEKWLRIEGLMKTIRENDIALSHIQFLVDQQLMPDYHLEFSNPWAIGGFLS